MKNISTETLVLLPIVIGVLVLFIALSVSIVVDSINDKPLEYTYKNLSERDLTLAMQYHGIDMITITETECFFVNADHVKVPVFTDGCIEYLYKNKQKEVRK